MPLAAYMSTLICCPIAKYDVCTLVGEKNYCSHIDDCRFDCCQDVTFLDDECRGDGCEDVNSLNDCQGFGLEDDYWTGDDREGDDCKTCAHDAACKGTSGK